MKKFIYIILSLTISLTLFGCTKGKSYDIVATMYPQYSISKEIAGDKLNVLMLYPPAVDIHNHEFSSQDIIKINNSKLFFYTSDIIEPKIQRMTLKNTEVINLEALINHEHDEHEYEEHDHAHSHYWTSFSALKEMSQIIYEKIISIDNLNSDYYLKNYNQLLAKIKEIETNTRELILQSETKTIFFAGHNSMEAFANEMNLTITALVDDIKPSADITSKQILDLVNKIKEVKASILYIPELESIKIANTIKRAVEKENVKLEILELHGFHNITKNQMDSNVSIINLLTQNYENLKRGLSND